MMDEAAKRLIEMVHEGKSDGEIATELGITHNAVVGRRWRLGLSANGAGAPAQPAQVIAARPAPVEPAPARVTSVGPPRNGKGRAPHTFDLSEPKAEPISPKLLKAFDDDATGRAAECRVTIVDLKETMCRWPFGDPHDLEHFRYCGAHAVQKPYCEEHRKLAGVPMRKPPAMARRR